LQLACQRILLIVLGFATNVILFQTKQNKTKQKALSPFFQIFYGNVATSQK
jgi:hypothetical protein